MRHWSAHAGNRARTCESRNRPDRRGRKQHTCRQRLERSWSSTVALAPRGARCLRTDQDAFGYSSACARKARRRPARPRASPPIIMSTRSAGTRSASSQDFNVAGRLRVLQEGDRELRMTYANTAQRPRCKPAVARGSGDRCAWGASLGRRNMLQCGLFVTSGWQRGDRYASTRSAS